MGTCSVLSDPTHVTGGGARILCWLALVQSRAKTVEQILDWLRGRWWTLGYMNAAGPWGGVRKMMVEGERGGAGGFLVL